MNFGSDPAILASNSRHCNYHTNRLASKENDELKRKFKEEVTRRGYKRKFDEANVLLSRLTRRVRMRFTVVRSLFKKIKYNNRRKRKRRRRDPRPENYTPSKVGAVFALRCTDENCGNEKNPYTSCLVDERDGNEVFGTVRDAEKHYEKYHAVETAVGDGDSIEDNGIIANAEPPATPQGHGATAPRRSPRNSDLINHVTRPDSTLTRTFI